MRFCVVYILLSTYLSTYFILFQVRNFNIHSRLYLRAMKGKLLYITKYNKIIRELLAFLWTIFCVWRIIDKSFLFKSSQFLFPVDHITILFILSELYKLFSVHVHQNKYIPLAHFANSSDVLYFRYQVLLSIALSNFTHTRLKYNFCDVTIFQHLQFFFKLMIFQFPEKNTWRIRAMNPDPFRIRFFIDIFLYFLNCYKVINKYYYKVTLNWLASVCHRVLNDLYIKLKIVLI